MQLITADSGGERHWVQSLPIAARYECCRRWEMEDYSVLAGADGGRQLVAVVEARDKKTRGGGTADAADAGATTKSSLLSGSAAHCLVLCEGVVLW